MSIYLENHWPKTISPEVPFLTTALLSAYVILSKCTGEKWYNLERIGLRPVPFLIGYKQHLQVNKLR